MEEGQRGSEHGRWWGKHTGWLQRKITPHALHVRPKIPTHPPSSLVHTCLVLAEWDATPRVQDRRTGDGVGVMGSAWVRGH